MFNSQVTSYTDCKVHQLPRKILSDEITNTWIVWHTRYNAHCERCCWGYFPPCAGRDDTKKVRKSEASINCFGLYTSDLSSDVPYSLSGPQLKIAQGRAHHIRVPAHVDVNPRHLFSRSSKLKSHDWKQVQVLEYV